jgi:hypothetical protein
MALTYDKTNNMINNVKAGDKIQVSLKLKKDPDSTEYKIINQQFKIISSENQTESELFNLPVQGGSKSDAYEQSSLVPIQSQYPLLKGGKRRFSNSNRMNIRRVYNRTMSRRD